MFTPEKLVIPCRQCGQDNVFEQPHAYHAGFGEQGFLYSDSGHCTLIWSGHDPAIDGLFPGNRMWMRDAAERERFERALRPAPDGGHWRFRNRPRCRHCSAPIGRSMLEQSYYVVYAGSVITDSGRKFALRAELQENAGS
jgi:hypothetical protein